MTSQPGHPVLQAPPSLWAGECWGCLVPPPGAPALFVKQKGFLEQHQAALADRCLRISSLPAARRQVSAPPANKLGPDPGDCAFPLRPTGKNRRCARGFLHPSQGHDPIFTLELESTKICGFIFLSFSTVCVLQESS